MTREDVLRDYKSEHEGNPSVYVGTYAKYNEGNLYGAWLDITKFSDADEFFEACRALHEDEADPELMFQDYECFPESMYSECMSAEDIQAIIDLYNDYDEDDRHAVFEYWDEVDDRTDPKTILDRLVYKGEFSDYAYDCAEDMIACSNAPECVSRYFDYKSWERDLSYDYNVTSNYVFSAY